VAKLEYTVVELPAVWPGTRTVFKKRAPFKTQWTRTLELLGRELKHLSARKVEMALAVRPNSYDIRADGMLRADARPGPAVIVSFLDTDGHRQAYPCDTFSWWQDNVYAIAIVLEDLRRAERYGVQSALLRAGFKALPGAGGTVATLSTGQAAHFIARMAGAQRTPAEIERVADAIQSDRELAVMAMREAKAKTHPDAGGTNQDWTLLQESERIIRAHFGGSL
jgi:hypothetical protein